MRDFASGFWPIRLHGGVFCGEQREYPISNSNTTAIGKGDVVTLSSGYVVRASDTTALPLGVFNGCSYVTPEGERKFSDWWPGTAGNSAVRAHIVDHPHAVMKVRTLAGTNLGAAMLGQVAELDAGSAVTAPGLSTMTLDLSTAAAAPGSSDEQFVIIGFDHDDVGSESVLVEVAFTRHLLK